MPPKADRNSRAWDMGTSTSSRSFELESWSYIQHKDYQLHLLQKTEKHTVVHPSIPCSESERLCFYRCYVTASYKIQMIYLQVFSISQFLWMYTMNVMFSGLSCNYLHVFLAAYSPDEHMFASKMVPLFVGTGPQIVLCGMFQLVIGVDLLSLLLHYTIEGFLYKTPWVRCRQRVFIKPYPFNYDTTCITTEEFMNLTKYWTFGASPSNTTRKYFFESNYYVKLDQSSKYPWFQIAPLTYFLRYWVRNSVMQYKVYSWVLYYVVLWVTVGLLYKLLFRKIVWRILKYAQLVLGIFYFLCMMYIVLTYLETDVKYSYDRSHLRQVDQAWGWDFDMLAESISGPPVVQLLTARSADRQIEPGRDSCAIVISNFMYYLFRSVVNYNIKTYVEDKLHGPVIVDWYNPYPLLTYWNIFFHSIFMGSLLVRTFYLLTFMAEFIIFAVTYHILLEVIVCEWRWTKRWIATILMSTGGIILSTFWKIEDKCFLYVFTTSLTGLTELVVVCWLYPMTRLFDDTYFHFGTPPQSYRKWCVRIVPIYGFYKLYTTFVTFRDLVNSPTPNARTGIRLDYSMILWGWTVAIGPVILGMIYAIIRYVIMKKQSWRILLKPRPDWGPRDHVTRQLRKQFDSQTYVGSQASRYLSRHLLSKAETSCYRLDIRYDAGATAAAGAAARQAPVFTEEDFQNKFQKNDEQNQ